LLQGGYAEVIETPWKFRQEAKGKKKIADWDPPPGRNARQNAFLGRQ
jgi:hypothetical protein